MRPHISPRETSTRLPIKSLSAGAFKRKPILQYNNFSFRAEIDWIEIKIRTLIPTNFQTVRNRLKVPYVKTVNEGSGGIAFEFWIKFYSLKRWGDIDQALERLTYDHPLAEPVEVTGIEIALDAYSKSSNRKELAEMASKFYQALTHPVSENRRITPGEKHTATAIPPPKMLMRRISQGENIYIGNKDPKGDLDDPNSWVLQHIYLKDVDRRRPIPIKEHRARVEVTLRGIALPHKSLADWRSHQFVSESHYFKFRKPKERLSELEKSTFIGRSQYGARKKKKSGPKRTVYSPLTLADIPLNNKAYDALRNLTKRLKGRLV